MAHMSNERFWELYEPNSRLFISIVNKLILDRDAVDDVLHDAVVNALRNFHQLRDIDRFVQWMSKIITHEAYAYIKKNRRKKEYELAVNLDQQWLFQAALQNNDIEDKAVHNEMLKKIKEAIKMLNPIEQMILYLRFYTDMKHKEIALLLDMTPSSVKMRQKRALEKLNSYLHGVEKF